MPSRSLGFTLPRYTTAQLNAFVSKYGPTGTVEANSLQQGNVVFDTTLDAVVVFDGTAFKPLAEVQT